MSGRGINPLWFAYEGWVWWGASLLGCALRMDLAAYRFGRRRPNFTGA